MQKTFKHNFVAEVDIDTTYEDGKRFYVLPNGNRYRSVTTVISDKSDKSFLEEWKKRVGAEEAQKISTQASRRGTAVHTIAENYILNQSYKDGVIPSNLDAFNTLKPFLDENVDNILGIELPLYSNFLRAAGRTDLVAEYKGVPSIIDYKTSRKNKKEEWIQNYFIQSSCYAIMFEWIYKIKIPQIVIMIAVDNEPAQIFIKDKVDYIDTVYEMFTT